MQFINTITILVAALASTAAAVPVAEEGAATLLYEHATSNETEVADGNALSKRGNAQATSWSGNNCQGSSAFFQVGSGSTQCWVIRGGSIQVNGAGCRTSTWSGNNCRGSSFVVGNSGCNPVQFASVLFEC